MTGRLEGLTSNSVLLWRERRRLFDRFWIFSLVVTLIVLFVSWFFQVVHFDLTSAAGSIFVYLLFYLLLGTAADHLRQRLLVLLIVALQLSTVLFLLLLWHLVGGLNHPMFLLLFAVPVISAGILYSGTWACSVALVSGLLVVGLALLESPDLRWYVSQVGIPVGWLTRLLPPMRSVRPFQGVETGPAYQFSLLEMFLILQFTLAIVSSRLVRSWMLLHACLQVSEKAVKELRSLFQAVIGASTEPGLILYAHNKQIVYATEGFLKQMLLRTEDLVGKTLFDLIDFVQPKKLRQALAEDRGEIRFCTYHVGPETRVANIHFHKAEFDGSTFVYLGFRELTDLYYLQTTFDSLSDSLLVIGADKRLLYFNLAAQEQFGSLFFGLETQALPTVSHLIDEWRKEPAPFSSRITEIDHHPYEVRATMVSPSEEAESCTVLWLHSLSDHEVYVGNGETRATTD